MPEVKQAHLEKLAEGWWDKAKRYYGYAAPGFLGGDARPDLSNRRKFKPMYQAPGNRDEMLDQLKSDRKRTLIGHDSKPGSLSKPTPELDALSEKIYKEKYAPGVAKYRTKMLGTGGGGTAVAENRKPTAYEKFKQQSIPLKDQPQQSLAGAPLKAQPKPPGPKLPPGKLPPLLAGDSGINVKMRSGRGYNWLAGQLNKQLSTGGRGALKPITASDLRKRMGGRMLYRNKQYSFDPTNLTTGKGTIAGGQSPKAIARAQRGMRQFVAKRTKTRGENEAWAKAQGWPSYEDIREKRRKAGSRKRYSLGRHHRRISGNRAKQTILVDLANKRITAAEANKRLSKYKTRVAVGQGQHGQRIVGSRTLSAEALQRSANREPRPSTVQKALVTR